MLSRHAGQDVPWKHSNTVWCRNALTERMYVQARLSDVVHVALLPIAVA